MKLIALLMMAADTNGQPPQDIVLLDFTAGYCQPCKQMVPVLQRMEKNKFPIVRKKHNYTGPTGHRKGQTSLDPH